MVERVRVHWLGLLLLLTMVLGEACVAQAEIDVTAKVQLNKGRLMHNRADSTSYFNVSLTNIYSAALLGPVKVVVESITDPSITVKNATGMTADGKPYFRYIACKEKFLAGVTTANKQWKFNNPKVLRFGYVVTVRAADVIEPNMVPVPSLVAAPLVGEAPLTVAFDTSASYDPDGKITYRKIDFDGDGAYDWSDATATGTSHLYDQPGSFRVTLRVTDDRGVSRLRSTDVVVTPHPNAPPEIAPMPILTVNQGEMVMLTPSITDPDGDTVTASYSGWMTTNNRVTTYADSGTHNVTVTATDEHGSITSRDVSITVRPISPVGTVGLVGYWPVDGGWEDLMGASALAPLQVGGFADSPFVRSLDNRSYGPTSAVTNNGAFAQGLTSVAGTATSGAMSLEGWVWLPDNNNSGELFGFGGKVYEEPKLNVSIASGFVQVNLGKGVNRAILSYVRPTHKCWHHIAFVVLPGKQEHHLYLDGIEISASTTTIGQPFGWPDLFGGTFRIGTFKGTSAHLMRVDEVRLWSRALSTVEVATLATATGEGEACANLNLPSWAPGFKRCNPPSPLPSPEMDLAIRVLTDDTLVVVSDPNPWLKSRVKADCGGFLKALEENKASVADYEYDLQYYYAVKDTLLTYRPAMLNALGMSDHFKLGEGSSLPVLPTHADLWPQATREFLIPTLATEENEIHTTSAEIVYFSYLRSPFSLMKNRIYTIHDQWGESVALLFDEDKTLSWALKVNQVGYLADAAEKYAYLGAWLGPNGGAADLSRFAGHPFQICREADGGVVHEGQIVFRKDDPNLSGEKVYQLDFSTLTTPGRYYVRVTGLGRSWSFELGQNAIGEAFYTHARGLFHQRCGTSLTLENTPWSRTDNHGTTFRAAFPPDNDDYKDHGSAGWGFRDQNGAFPSYAGDHFKVVDYTKTTEVAPGVSGGWHDAADFDRRPQHFGVVSDLVHAYLLFPQNFADGQLHIPESANSIPDILDEAVWGMDVWLRAQEPDGRVATWIEATSHPRVNAPGADTQPYYLGLATRNSSLDYAAHAALLGRALVQAGASNRGQEFIQSARQAYAFGTNSTVRVSTSFLVSGETHTWTEAPEPNPSRRVQALIQLWLATSDQSYAAELATPAMATAFAKEVTDLTWRTGSFDIVDVALAPGLFPPNWGADASKRILWVANAWLAWQTEDPYRKLWYSADPNSPNNVNAPTNYFNSIAWGNSGFLNIRHLVAAWRLTGEERFRSGALLAVDWFHGANPQGRVNTTGLGHHNTVSPLHLPSEADLIREPVPGITIYGYTGAFPWAARTQVYGLFDDRKLSPYDFPGSSLAQLPPPWNATTLTTDQIGEVLYSEVPIWRRLVSLESTNVGQSEFTVNETISPAAAVTGCLMGAGWQPTTETLSRQPKTDEELKDSLWYQP